MKISAGIFLMVVVISTVQGESFEREMAHQHDFLKRQDVLDTISDMQRQFNFEAPSENDLNIKPQPAIDFKQNVTVPVAEKPEAYCSKGDCFKPTEEKLEGMEKGLSELSALFKGGSEFDGSSLFKGVPMFCRKQGFGFNDCCKDKGWGQDLSLTRCHAGEKDLAMAKEAKRIIAVGEFCSKKVMRRCVEKKKSYCVYPSKLARIFQNGTHHQLGVDFGSAKNPICAGVSPAQLQALDLDRVDFSDFYKDIKSKDISKSVSNYIKNSKNNIAKNKIKRE